MASISLDRKFASIAPPSKHAELIALQADTPANEALRILNDFHILSAPVFEDKDHKKFLGLLDLLDLSAFALSVIHELDRFEKVDNDSVTWKMLFDNALRTKMSKDLINFSEANFVYPLNSRATFGEILDMLSSKGVHRVPIIKDNGKVKRLVTQSEVLRFVSQNLDLFQGLDKSVLMAGLVGKGTIYVSTKESALDAFTAIVTRKVSAVAVLDEEQRLVGNVSIRDLRRVVKDSPEFQLRRPLGVVLAELNGGKHPPVTVGVDSTVRNAITKIISGGVHRVYVVDENQYPQGVISSTDIFAYLLRAAYASPVTRRAHVTASDTRKPLVSPRSMPESPISRHLSILDEAFQIMFPDFKEDNELFYVLGDASAEQVLGRLRDKKVMCVPVLDALHRTDHQLRVQGLVDVADIATAVLELNRTRPTKGPVIFNELHQAKLKGVLAKDLINASGLDRAAILGVQTRVMDVFSALTIPGVQRVPVMAKSEDPKEGQRMKPPVGKFITRSQVLRFIATHLDSFGKVIERSVVSARVGNFRVKYVKSTQTALEGFRTLVHEVVSGLPIIDNDFKVVGALSTSDLRTVVAGRIDLDLNQPVLEFLENVRADESVVTPSRLVTCSYVDTVHTVITKLHSNQVHRLFIVDEKGVLLGIVALSDVLKYILRSGSPY